MLKIAQMSDLHFCSKNLVESERTFAFSVDNAIARNVRAAVITGDSTDHALDAHEPALHALAHQLKRLADHCPVLMLQGTFSHEPVGLLRMFKMIGAKHRIEIAEKIGMFGLDASGFSVYLPGNTYELVVTSFPTVNKAELASGTGLIDSKAMGDTLFHLLCQFGSVNAALKDSGVPTMLIGHGTVQECETEHGVPMAGMDHEFGTGALFAAKCDVVALGHIHKHQSWRRDKQIIAYAGSIGRFHHGEDGHKHYLVWGMSANNSSFEAVVTPSRKTVDLFFDGIPNMEVISNAVKDCSGAYVRVRYNVDVENTHHVNRDAIKAILSDACDVQIEGRVLVIERQRAAGISTTDGLAPKLQKWCDVTHTESSQLLERLTSIETMTAQEIAVETMKRIRNNVQEPESPKNVGNADGVAVVPDVGSSRDGVFTGITSDQSGSEKVCSVNANRPEAATDRVLSQDGLFA